MAIEAAHGSPTARAMAASAFRCSCAVSSRRCAVRKHHSTSAARARMAPTTAATTSTMSSVSETSNADAGCMCSSRPTATQPSDRCAGIVTGRFHVATARYGALAKLSWHSTQCRTQAAGLTVRSSVQTRMLAPSVLSHRLRVCGYCGGPQSERVALNTSTWSFAIAPKCD